MNSKEYVSIVVDYDKIVLVEGYKTGTKYIITNYYSCKRTESMSLSQQVKEATIKGGFAENKSCICIRDDLKTKFMQVPVMDHGEIRKMIDYETEAAEWLDEQFYAQFLRRIPSQYSDDENMMDLFLVALKRVTVQEAAKIVIASNFKLHIISYWPGELIKLYDDHKYVIIVNVSETRAEMYAWDEEMLLSIASVEATPLAVAQQVELWRASLFNDNLEGIHILWDTSVIEKGMDESTIADWNAIEEEIGTLRLKDIEISGSLQDIINKGSISDLIAIGGIIRCCQ